MKLRVVKLLHPDFDPLVQDAPKDLPTVGTFHSVCAQILRREIHILGYENRFVIFDDNDQVVLMKEIMKEQGLDEKQLNPKAVLAHISQAKNELMGPEAYHQLAHNFFTEKVASLYVIYQSRLARHHALDFDDLLMKTVEFFKTYPDILDRYQERYRYLSVDEYQDTNHAQYVFIKLLAEKYRNICVIGDPDQSIYSWRGANMQNILDFEKDYPEALVIKLEQNYRSTAVILDAAHSVIEKNRNRKEKRLWTQREGGALLRIWTTRDERDEAFKIAEAIREHLRTHERPDYREFAVLYRTNAQSRVLEEAFIRYGLPYKIVGGVKFYLRKEIKDVVAYLRLIQNPDDDVSLLRSINTPPRKIGPKSIEILQVFASRHSISLFRAMERTHEIPELGSKAKHIESFVKLIANF
ncbi:MAG: UvrD-helicase domain-containing protein, partial [Patescibacteria group bacterium]